MRPSTLRATGALLLAIAGVGWWLSAGEAVAIRTSEPGHNAFQNPDGTYTTGCYLAGTQGELVTDPVGGVAINGDFSGHQVVVWPAGFTGQRYGSEIAILDASGHVVARTGTVVYLEGGNEDAGFVTCPTGIHPPH